ncbi:MAG: HD domain-containing protein [Anaerolineae bacterium]
MAKPPDSYDEVAFGRFLRAVAFAAEKHSGQRRKGVDRRPYVNHPIAVAQVLWNVGGVRDVATLIAALLHDALEDTHATPDEIAAQFGDEVLALVQEVTDDKSLPKATRKQLQIDHAASLSRPARLIKLADKIQNVYDLGHAPPKAWSQERQSGYVDWADEVVAQLRGTDPALEALYDGVAAEARRRIEDAEGESSPE